MPRWEVCRIVEHSVRVDRNLLRKQYFFRYIAESDTPQVIVVIDQTPEWEHWNDFANSDQIQKAGKVAADYQSELVGRLLSNGWEPLNANKYGKLITLRRQVP